MSFLLTWKRMLAITVVFVFVFFWGIAIGASKATNKSVMAHPVPVKTITKVVPVSNINDWKHLKTVDDQVSSSCSNAFAIVSDIFQAQGELDFKTADEKNKELIDAAQNANEIMRERQVALQKLGY